MSFLDFQKKIHKVGVFLDRPNQVFKNFKIKEVYFFYRQCLLVLFQFQRTKNGYFYNSNVTDN